MGEEPRRGPDEGQAEGHVEEEVGGFGDEISPAGGIELRDVGLGLRLAPTRASSKIVHIDLAFPLDGDSGIDSVQILVEAKKSF